MGDKLPREIENPLCRYLTAISKLRLGMPNGNKQTAFPKAELEAFFRSLTTGKKKKNAKMLQMWVNDMQWC